MPDIFGVEGGPGSGSPGRKKPDPSKPKRKSTTGGDPDMLYGSMDPRAGEGKAGRYVQYDNESGAIELNLPPHVSKYKAELEEDLMDAFYGEPGGAVESSRTMDAWVADWIEKKEKEDPELRRDAEGDAPG